MTDRRGELLDAATAWVFEHGLDGLSLRPLAAALGTSDRMLLYYFGSKDGLLSEVAESAARDLASALALTAAPDRPWPSARAWLEACWSIFTDPGVRPAMALLFELDALAVRRPGPMREAARSVGEAWAAVVNDAIRSLGVPARRRRALGKVVGAALVGLVLEALVQDGDLPAPAIAVLASLVEDARPT